MKVKTILKHSASIEIELVDYTEGHKYESYHIDILNKKGRNDGIFNIDNSIYLPEYVLDAEVKYISVNSATKELSISYIIK